MTLKASGVREPSVTVPFGLIVGAAGLALSHATVTSNFLAGSLFFGTLVVCFAVSTRTGGVLRIYVVFMALWFLFGGVFGIESGVDLSQVWLISSVWMCGWTAGQLLFHRGPRHGGTRVRGSVGFTHRDAAAALGLIGLVALGFNLIQVLHGTSSYAAQLAGEASTGVTTTIAGLAAPALAAALICSWRAYGRSVRALLLLAVVLEGILLAFSGFRGATIEYLATVLLAFFVVTPPTESRQRKRLAVGGVVAILVIGIPSTLYGAGVRNQLALEAGRNSQPLSLSTLPKLASARLDETSNLGAAIEADGAAAKEVVNPRNEISVFVPRFLWPSKPEFNYGQQVSTIIFHLDPVLHTSSTITWLGDLYLIDGLPLILAMGIILGALARQILLRAGNGTVFATILSVLVISLLIDPENPLILSIAGLLKSLLIMTAVSYVLIRTVRLFRAPVAESPGSIRSFRPPGGRHDRRYRAEAMSENGAGTSVLMGPPQE